MLLTSRDRRWLSSDVQSDLLLVCRDGSVPAHSAFLAGCSPFLAVLLSQPSARLCGGCRTPRSLILAGVGARECRGLVELLYTGKTPLNTDLDNIKSLGLVLGLDLSKLELIRGQRKPTLSHRLSSDGTDGVHHRFRKSNINQAEQQDLKPVRPNTTKAISVISSGLKNLFQNPKKQPNAEDQNCSLLRAERLSTDLLAEPLSSFPTRKLPMKTPVIPRDNLLPDTEAEGQVIVPNAVLSAVMQMIPVENIKEEVEDFPQMEGREEDEKDASNSVTSYLSMKNSKNFVCDGCDSTFTFIRSYNWHRQRCRGREPVKTSNNKTEGGSNPSSTCSTVVCKYCNERVTGIKKHLSLVHFKSQLLARYSRSPLRCKDCGKCFKAVNSLVLHIGVQHGRIQTVVNEGKDPASVPPVPSLAGQTKEKNSLYQASQLKKKLERGVGPAGSSKEGFVSVKFGQNIKTKISPGKSVPAEDKKKTNGGIGVGGGGGGGGGRKVPCGLCVKCLLADCGTCVPCSGGGDPGLARVCVKKVCRNKVWLSD